SGFKVARLRESTSTLLNFGGPKPATLVMVGRLLVPVTKSERDDLLRWVENGGCLVIIDRNPDRNLLPPSDQWIITMQTLHYPSLDLEATNLEQMTGGVKPLGPSQPTAPALQVETILPSRFAAEITIEPNKSPKGKPQAGSQHSDRGNTHEPAK